MDIASSPACVDPRALSISLPADNEEPRLAKLRGMDGSQLHAWARSVEAQPSPLFRNSSTCLCTHVVETNWRTYGPRKQPMVWFMERVLGFTNATARWGSLAFPPGAVLAVPARAVLTRPKLVYEIIYALTNGSDLTGAAGQRDDVWAPQLTFHGWENGIQRKWAPFSWAHNFERLWVRPPANSLVPGQRDADARTHSLPSSM